MRMPPPRERMVLVLAMSGLSNREIARALGLAAGTVKAYKERLRARGWLPRRGDAPGH
jgi:DNA-binding NarL/FixJ family response regulator